VTAFNRKLRNNLGFISLPLKRYELGYLDQIPLCIELDIRSVEAVHRVAPASLVDVDHVDVSVTGADNFHVLLNVAGKVHFETCADWKVCDVVLRHRREFRANLIASLGFGCFDCLGNGHFVNGEVRLLGPTPPLLLFLFKIR
jgi:hypothetical protein